MYSTYLSTKCIFSEYKKKIQWSWLPSNFYNSWDTSFWVTQDVINYGFVKNLSVLLGRIEHLIVTIVIKGFINSRTVLRDEYVQYCKIMKLNFLHVPNFPAKQTFLSKSFISYPITFYWGGNTFEIQLKIIIIWNIV